MFHESSSSALEEEKSERSEISSRRKYLAKQVRQLSSRIGKIEIVLYFNAASY